ncbi:hypothetical protein AA313_de0205722 [Arthrobotrys entomopaga]|nr:hypothetical protein AA313_de0205722 [Arthrobotrys entomopaga]
MSPIHGPVPKKRKLDQTAIQNDTEPTRRLTLDPCKPTNEIIADFIKTQKHNRKIVASVTKFAELIKDGLSNAEPLNFRSLHEAEALFRERKVLIPHPACNENSSDHHVFSFSSPTQIEIGSGLNYGYLRKVKNESPAADLIVKIPAHIIHPKDYLEHRYMRKRALYLSYLVLILIGKITGKEVSYLRDFLEGDKMRPIVLIKSSYRRLIANIRVSHKVNCIVRIIPAITPDYFPLHKLSPLSCRAHRNTGTPTPEYNASIIADAYHFEHAELLRATAISNSGFEGGVILGSVWLSHRRYSSHILDGGFGEMEWALLQLHVLDQNADTDSPLQAWCLDPLQLFKLVLKAISDIDIRENGLSDKSRAPPRSYKPSIFRSKSSYNILFRTALRIYPTLRREARAALLLGTQGLSTRSQFSKMFVDVENRGFRDLDLVARLPIDTARAVLQLPEYNETRWSLGCIISDHCYEVLSQGLGDRCRSMFLSTSHPSPKSIVDINSNNVDDCHRSYSIDVFITLDEKNSTRIMDHGPNVENSIECTIFRDFWQEKSELRRFKDGRVTETVKWESTRSIAEQIIRFLYPRLTGVSASAEPLFYGPSFENPILPQNPKQDIWNPFDRAISEFQMVADLMRQLPGFPLSFKSIRGTCPELRFASVDPPFPCPQQLGSPLYAKIELESSTGWPNDAEQRRRSEIGLLLKLSHDLDQTGRLGSTQVGLHPSGEGTQKEGFIDVLTKSCYFFRFYISNIADEAYTKNRSEAPANTKSTIIPTLTNRNFVLSLYDHIDVILRMSKRHQYFSSTIRLVKAWFRSHYFASFYGDEILELFGAIGFNTHSDVPIPSSTFCGFRRTMSELSQWDWRKGPLELELSRPFTDDERKSLSLEFESSISSLQETDEVGLFVAIAQKDRIISYLRCIVPRLVASRMTEMARKVHKTLIDLEIPIDKLFAPDITGFDFVIRLKHMKSPRELSKTYANVTTSPSKTSILFSRRQFTQELQRLTGQNILFFPSWDFLTIGAMWKHLPGFNSSSLVHDSNMVGHLLSLEIAGGD